MKLPSLFESSGNATGSQIGWVPANLFFAKTIQLPEGVGDDEVASFTELEIEELSPFPLEQLVWGYFEDATKREVYAFATVKPRISHTLLDRWDDWVHVYPTFIHLVDVRVQEPTIKGLWHDTVVSLVYYDGESPFPKVFEHELLNKPDESAEEDEDTNDEKDSSSADNTTGQLEQALAAYERLKANFGIEGKRVEEGLLVVSEKSTSDHDRVVLNLNRYTKVDEKPEALVSLTVSQSNGLWSAELRSSEYVENRLKVIDFERKLWKAYQLTALVAVLCICMLVGNGVFAWLVDSRNDRYDAQLDSSSAISEKIGYLESLEQFSGEQFQPRQIFEELNQYRPKQIYFKNLEARVTENRVHVQGIAKKVKQVNEYVDTLLKTGHFQRDSVRTDTGSKGDVKFNMKLFYTPASAEVSQQAEGLIPTGEDIAAIGPPTGAP